MHTTRKTTRNTGSIIAAITAAALLASCSNPADKTTDAKVGEAVKKVADDPAGGVKYAFTSDSTIGFTGSKVTGSHSGGFKSFTGHFTIAGDAPVGNDHKVVIDMASTWSDDEKLTGHLKSADFFDVGQFPQTTFDVTSLEKRDDTSYLVAGNLNLHGVTKNIQFPATVSKSDGKIKISAEFDIKRKDFGIVYPGKPDDLIRDEVVIRLDLSAVPQP